MLSLANDQDLTCYFLDLYQYAIKYGTKFPFDHYLRFCEENGCIDKELRNKDFFYYYLQQESNSDDGTIKEQIPAGIEQLIGIVKNKLYIKSVSRCEHCVHFSNEKCTAGEKNECHYWVTCDDACGKFVFDPKRWS